MTRKDLAARLLATFRGELDEQLRAMTEDLLALEARPDDVEHLKRLFRAAHTLKGAAHAAGIVAVERTCHTLEARLAAARDLEAPLGPADFSQLFQALDALEMASAQLASGADPASDEAAQPAPSRAANSPAVGASPEASASSGRSDAGTSSGSGAAGRGRSGTDADARGRSSQVRVDEAKLDSVLSTAAELLASAGRLETLVGGLGDAGKSAVSESRRLRRLSGAMREDMRRLRTRPFTEACEPLPRLVRDLGTSSGKGIRLEVSGEDVEADRTVLDAIRESLIHLVRNAVDHGIESPARRQVAGKPASGSIAVDASIRGDRIVVTVSDDGGGLDLDALRAQLARRDVPIPADQRGWVRVLFGGGLSSRTEATTISGRGVGLESVRAAVERVGGVVDLSWDERGTTFTLDCPLTIAVQRLLIAAVGGHLVAFPTADVERLEHVAADDVRRADGQDVLPDPEGPVRLASLARLLGPRFQESEPGERLVVVRLRSPHGRLAVVVDSLVAEEEVLIHALEGTHRPAGSIAGVALGASERIALVLRTPAIMEAGLRGDAVGPRRANAAPAQEPPRILVADDSITTRTLERNVLETAGYLVTTAADGAEAWRLLQDDPFDLVLSDIEMPNMDGFELCRAIRGARHLEGMPVVLLTALDSPEQRDRGLELGADAYLVKSSFDQEELLELLRQLVGRAA